MTSHHPFFIHHQMPQKEGALLPLCRSSGTSTRATSPQMFVLWYQHPCHFSSKVRTLLTLCRSSGTSTRATSQRFVLWYQHPCHVSSKVRPLVPAPVPRLLKGSSSGTFMPVLWYPHRCHVSSKVHTLLPLCRPSCISTRATSPQRFVRCSLYAGPLVPAPMPRLPLCQSSGTSSNFDQYLTTGKS